MADEEEAATTEKQHLWQPVAGADLDGSSDDDNEAPGAGRDGRNGKAPADAAEEDGEDVGLLGVGRGELRGRRLKEEPTGYSDVE